MFTVQQKLFSTIPPAIFFELPTTRTPDNSKFLSISLEGSIYRQSTVSGLSPSSFDYNMLRFDYNRNCVCI